MMNDWYESDVGKFMFDNLKCTELSMSKKMAFLMMIMRLYDFVGIEMTVHHKNK